MGMPATAADRLPSGDQLLMLEREVRAQGTGLRPAQLLGCWKLRQVWPKGSSSVASLSSVLLRSLDASLMLSAGASQSELAIANSVTLGALRLRFDGLGRLLGKRPLLQFSFSSVELSLAGQVLLKRPLAPTTRQRLPFFALIARDSSGWLAARGRGGGLALWRLAP